MKTIAFASSLLFAASLATAQAAVVFSDGFESDSVGVTGAAEYAYDGSGAGNTLTNWTVLQGSVEVIDNGYNGYSCNDTRCIITDGASTLNYQQLVMETKQSFTVNAGDIVTLSVVMTDLASTFDPFELTFGSITATFVNHQTNPQTFTYTTIATTSFTAPVQLKVVNPKPANNSSQVLDDLTLAIDVDEPSFLVLGGLIGLVGLGYARRR
ncbi:MAG: hypothetical protein KDC18_11160 [Alphaproteobacteria bacterium]|nr:hypothetical protein [Alphaproteobacteria bacterium]